MFIGLCKLYRFEFKITFWNIAAALVLLRTIFFYFPFIVTGNIKLFNIKWLFIELLFSIISIQQFSKCKYMIFGLWSVGGFKVVILLQFHF